MIGDFSDFITNHVRLVLFLCVNLFQRMHIGEKSLSFCNTFLEEMSKEAKNIITNICDQQCVMADKVKYLVMICNYIFS